ncbi:Mitochondrial distribution and morphology protein 12 [Cytospora mali]|uniref:Mitochondrial distribution and morphology protein 12 n=1 Tax=Cytospora mali TaxID=578113 RepID=A0A194V9E5_CYTMA|nr:Mitochondrial distribution and morphology protein 12 [Valsa mali var. pyri (nom. inval.)]
MSIDLNWETFTTGADGEALAHSIRDFIHTKFQSVPLPRFIKSVTVHDFEFGTTPPELELKDITDPLPDFYEENSAGDDEDSDDDEEEDEQQHFEDDIGAGGATGVSEEMRAAAEWRRRNGQGARLNAIPPHLNIAGWLGSPSRGGSPGPLQDFGSPFLGTSTPGIPGGTSNLNYFHSHLMGGPSGTQTPLAAVAGAHLGNNNHGHNFWAPETEGSSPTTTTPISERAARQRAADSRAPSHSRNPSQSSITEMEFNNNSTGGLNLLQPSSAGLREKSSVSTIAPTSPAGTSRPPTRDNTNASASILKGSAIAEDDEAQDGEEQKSQQRRFREPRTDDIQAVFRIKYSGDVKLLLTADILLDYPMPSFVGIPLQLSITGMSFDGVGVVAHIRKRVHFCFLSPEDALAAVGADEEADQNTRPGKMGGLLQEIRVESEIGQREGGKQSLKNVGKVERFVLEQVRRIFEEEFVYPSFWTFLV